MDAAPSWLAPPPIPASVLHDALSPSLLILLDRVRHNLAQLLGHLDGRTERWRPHVKTAKLPEVMAELVRSGVLQFKCATLQEADVLLSVLDAEQVHGDVLVAMPLNGPNLTELGRLTDHHPRHAVSVLCENPERVPAIPPGIGVFVDVNVGMNRTGIEVAARDRIAAVARAAGLRLRGLHAYEGHIHDASPTVRLARTFSMLAGLDGLWQHLRGLGLSVPEIVTSGTPTFIEALTWPDADRWPGTVHRVSPGTVIYHDVQYGQLVPELGLLPAALVLARVVSHPTAGVVTLDAGAKSLAAEQGDPCAVALGYPHLEALKPSEEHLPLRVHRGTPPPPGTAILLAPRHVCPTVNLASHAILLDGDRVVGVVPVVARGHRPWDDRAPRDSGLRGRGPDSTL